MIEIPKEARKFKPETRERVRRAIAQLLESEDHRGSKRLISVAKLVDAQGGGDRNATTTCLRLWRRGELSVADSWDDAPAPSAGTVTDDGEDEDGYGYGYGGPRAQLMAAIRAADTDGERGAVAQEAAALVAGGLLDKDSAQAIKGLLSDARASAVKARETEPPPEDPTRFLLASEEAMTAARAIDLMVDDERRDRVLALVAAELEADRVQHPNVDEGGA